jgi:predicted nucleic acid-binding protein
MSKLIDANFIIFLFVGNEKNHGMAVKIWNKIKQEDKIMSNLILTEIINL